VNFVKLTLSGLASMYLGLWLERLLLAIMDVSAHAISLPDRFRSGHLGSPVTAYGGMTADLRLETRRQGVWQRNVEQAARTTIAQQHRQALIADLEQLFNPPPPAREREPEIETVYAEGERGTARLGYSDFNPRLMTRPHRWWWSDNPLDGGSRAAKGPARCLLRVPRRSNLFRPLESRAAPKLNKAKKQATQSAGKGWTAMPSKLAASFLDIPLSLLLEAYPEKPAHHTAPLVTESWEPYTAYGWQTIGAQHESASGLPRLRHGFHCSAVCYSHL
jgi:hypothetical protein